MYSWASVTIAFLHAPAVAEDPFAELTAGMEQHTGVSW